jgi:tetratricopeptide (TPR) repeat protein
MARLAHIGSSSLLLIGLCVWSASGHGDVEERVAETDRQLAREPGRAELYARRGRLHGLQGMHDRALADFQVARTLADDVPGLDYGEAEALRATGRHPEAVKRYRRFLAHHGRHAGAWCGLGRSLSALGRDADAVAAFDAALAAMATPDPDTVLRRARVEARRGPDHVQAALAGLDEATERLGPVPALVSHAVRLEVAADRPDRALARIDALLAGPGDRSHWLSIKGKILAESGRTAEAAEAYDEALAALAALPAHRRSTPAMVRRLHEFTNRREALSR